MGVNFNLFKPIQKQAFNPELGGGADKGDVSNIRRTQGVSKAFATQAIAPGKLNFAGLPYNKSPEIADWYNAGELLGAQVNRHLAYA